MPSYAYPFAIVHRMQEIKEKWLKEESAWERQDKESTKIETQQKKNCLRILLVQVKVVMHTNRQNARQCNGNERARETMVKFNINTLYNIRVVHDSLPLQKAI